MTIWQKITFLGGIQFSGSIALAIAFAFLIGTVRSWRLTICWCSLFCGVMIVALCSQVAFLGWGIGINQINFSGFSGHATRAAAVFPVVFFLIFEHKQRRLKLTGILFGVLVAILVAVSRISIGAHSISESLAGIVLGLVAPLILIPKIQNKQTKAITPMIMAACIIFPFFALQRNIIFISSPHQFVIELALNLSGHDHPYSRIN